jgi:CheY-like chemotaxis protein
MTAQTVDVPAVRSASIVVVSDNAPLARLLHEALDVDERFAPQAGASDLASALRRLGAEDRPDLVLLDRLLPGLENIGALQQLIDASPSAGIIVHPGRASGTATGASTPRSFVDALGVAVSPTPFEAVLLPGYPTPSSARRVATEVCGHQGVAASIADSVALVVSELVANAAVPGARPVSLHLGFTDHTVLVDVRDADATMPLLEGRDLGASSGRGLDIVGAHAIAWGLRSPFGGKAIWAVLGCGTVASNAPLLPVGTVVEVMNPYTGDWRNGFVVAQGGERGYVLARADDDGAQTPPIPPQRVRPAHST